MLPNNWLKVNCFRLDLIDDEARPRFKYFLNKIVQDPKTVKRKFLGHCTVIVRKVQTRQMIPEVILLCLPWRSGESDMWIHIVITTINKCTFFFFTIYMNYIIDVRI